MSLFSRLFGGGASGRDNAAPQPEPEEHNGFRIYPEPRAEGGQFRLAARIEKEIDGQTRTHHLVRADLVGDRDTAATASVQKARSMIDQMGDGIFD